jgi:hypothetical protein
MILGMHKVSATVSLTNFIYHRVSTIIHIDRSGM